MDESNEDFWELLFDERNASSAADVASRLETQELVRAGIERLAERQRLAVTLCDVEGRTYAQVADVMHTTPDGAKSLIHRARTNLRKQLDGPHKRGDLEFVG